MPGTDAHTDRKPKIVYETRLNTIDRIWLICEPYAADYLGLAILVTSQVLCQLFLFDQPFHRLFTLDDKRISFPHAEVEHVPVFWLLIFACAIPGAIIVVCSLTLYKAHKAHVNMLGFAISILLTLFLTDVIKNAVGRPRPDLIDRCKAKPGTPLHVGVQWTVCGQSDHHILHDGWRSFPSGHSSMSFAGLGYLSFFLISQLRVFLPRAGLAMSILAFCPFLPALLIAITRLEDYRHDVFDVIAGSCLGLCVAYWSWRRYYPALSSVECSEPYGARAAEDVNGGLGTFGRIRDEEDTMGSPSNYELSEDGRTPPWAR